MSDLLGTALSRIEYARLAFHLRAVRGGSLPRHGGAVLRSAFGAALRAVSCDNPDSECSSCPTRDACAYLYLFETPLPPDARFLRAADRLPHPFVLRAWGEDRARVGGGDLVTIEVILVGRAIDLLPHVMVAVGRMAMRGLGRERLPLRLVGIDQLEGREGRARTLFDSQRQVDQVQPEGLQVPDISAAVEIELLTPTNLVSDGRSLRQLEFAPLVRALLRRASALSAFHCNAALELDYRALVDRAGTVHVAQADTRHVSFKRYSSRQGQRVPQEGLVGRARLEGDALRELAPLLALGEVVHVGKGTAMGMGRYQIDVPGHSRA